MPPGAKIAELQSRLQAPAAPGRRRARPEKQNSCCTAGPHFHSWRLQVCQCTCAAPRAPPGARLLVGDAGRHGRQRGLRERHAHVLRLRALQALAVPHPPGAPPARQSSYAPRARRSCPYGGRRLTMTPPRVSRSCSGESLHNDQLVLQCRLGGGQRPQARRAPASGMHARHADSRLGSAWHALSQASPGSSLGACAARAPKQPRAPGRVRAAAGEPLQAEPARAAAQRERRRHALAHGQARQVRADLPSPAAARCQAAVSTLSARCQHAAASRPASTHGSPPGHVLPVSTAPPARAARSESLRRPPAGTTRCASRGGTCTTWPTNSCPIVVPCCRPSSRPA